jgi:hypothetical protein
LLEPVGNSRPRLMVTASFFMKYKTRLMVYFGYSAQGPLSIEFVVSNDGNQLNGFLKSSL